jgi:hypothetical protein
MISFDASEVRKLTATLRAAPSVTARAERQVIQKAAYNIKRDWQREWTGLQNLPGLASAVTYETRVTQSGPEAVIGPETGRWQGELAPIAEFGTINNPPHPGGGPAMEREAPRFERALADLVEKAFR